ncbi:MAG: hypothetical protein AMXMBFR4_27590 [Candidatus Hydrogenedentota bacterium]
MGTELVLAFLSGVFSLAFSPIQTIFALLFQPFVLIQFLPLFLSYMGF